MVDRWNAKVKDGDTVYHLGDVSIARKGLQQVKRLNGRKILIRGNHDVFKDEDYKEIGFQQIHGVRVFVDKFILSHIPLHPGSVSDRFRVNVHGHLHGNQVMSIKSVGPGPMDIEYTDEPSLGYLCVSVEQTNFEPLHFDEVEARVKARWDVAGYEPKAKAWGNGSGPG